MLELEKGPSEEASSALIEEIFREAHSLKGSAGTLGLSDMERVAHAAEDLFNACHKKELALTPDIVDTVLQTLDALTAMLARARTDEKTPEEEIKDLVARIEAPLRGGQAPPGKPEPPPVVEAPPAKARTAKKTPKTAGPETPAPEVSKPEPEKEPEEEKAAAAPKPIATTFERTIRVSMQKLDSFMRQAEEILLAKIRVDQRLSEVRLLSEQVQAALRDLDRSKDGVRRMSKDWKTTEELAVLHYIKQSGEQLKNVGNRLNFITRNLVNDSQQMQLMNQNLQEDLKGLRLMPIGSVFEPFHRMVRDLSKRLEKKVALEVSGSDIEVDKRIIEEIKDPLVHILRNCVDHGVEMPADRAKANKSETGTIELRTEQRGNRLFIVIKDDGRGIDPKLLRRAAAAKGIIAQDEADQMSDEDARRLVFAPGFSTAAAVTDISGRGVGLDVVKQNIGRLGGVIELASELGKSTMFSISVPLTLATAQGLLVSLRSETYALPLNSVERILRFSPSDLAMVRGKSNIRLDGRLVPFVALAEVLNIPQKGLATDAQGMFSAVVVGAVEKRVAFAVDAVLEEQEIVTKALGKPLVRVKNVAGATILGDGSVVVLLNPNDLVRTAFGESIKSPELHAEGERSTVLVADDTITTRTLQKSLLEMAGFRVITAKDGEEAFQLLQQEAVQVLVTDVQMPRLDGFDLTARVRNDARFRNLPVILVTSLGSEADKARGIEVGADAYIVKKEYEKGKILEVIRQLL
ncbi:MAG: hybrid sensor histidine kinase/response regulator [Deltaproteobacteria bacterium]|nr:hybrid sensor histidine kinase/response regulator [Deltaproteobacteria bacterium]